MAGPAGPAVVHRLYGSSSMYSYPQEKDCHAIAWHRPVAGYDKKTGLTDGTYFPWTSPVTVQRRVHAPPGPGGSRGWSNENPVDKDFIKNRRCRNHDFGWYENAVAFIRHL